ncbi:hypothetical protein Bca52824_015422 [Brassica carinata]|uniref:Uncharacterized protein n=1 Tax=Brassica carinata TaxID=52824 RepID=A0A8X8B358_BRACI|nr:hypothetical protein Bca52824_015422 [Brassica carinata]
MVEVRWTGDVWSGGVVRSVCWAMCGQGSGQTSCEVVSAVQQLYGQRLGGRVMCGQEWSGCEVCVRAMCGQGSGQTSCEVVRNQ